MHRYYHEHHIAKPGFNGLFKSQLLDKLANVCMLCEFMPIATHIAGAGAGVEMQDVAVSIEHRQETRGRRCMYMYMYVLKRAYLPLKLD